MSTLPLPSSAGYHDLESARADNEALRIRGENHLALAITIGRTVYLVLLALIPPGCMGIAVGASAVVLNLAAPSVHLGGLLIIWITTTIISVTAIVAGIVEARNFNRDGGCETERGRE
ncbi:MAG: hypothetical protein ACM3U2_02660 [Deltaproteobacteria bacterium]